MAAPRMAELRFPGVQTSAIEIEADGCRDVDGHVEVKH
jgi:hypothetical protein